LLYTTLYVLGILFPGNKVEIYTFGPNGYEKIDVTKEVREIVDEKEIKKYDDIDYLAERANMKKNDPKFDPEFWSMYFKKVDEKRLNPNQKMDKLMKLIG